MKLSKFSVLALGAAMAAVMVTGCGSSNSTDYPPLPAYGPNANECYFAYSAAEVDYLESQLPTNQILHKIFRASESSVIVSLILANEANGPSGGGYRKNQ